MFGGTKPCCSLVEDWPSTRIYGDLEVIQGNKDSVESRAAAMLYKWLTSGKATKQALVEAVRVVK